MPEKDSILVIWLKLLTLAGQQNNGGVFLFKGKIPYTDEMLATIFNRPLNTVRLALQTFESLGMIEIVDNVYTLPNWAKHQSSLDKLENKKEYDREYQARKRAEQKLLASGGDNRTTIVRPSYEVVSLEEDKDIDIEIDKDIDISKSAKKPPKHKLGSLRNVLLTDEEYRRLVKDYGEEKTKQAIEYLSTYIAEKGYKTKDHNLTLRRWVYEAIERQDTPKYPGGSKKMTTAKEAEDRGSGFTNEELEALLSKLHN